MARSISTIFNEIVHAKESNAELQSLTNSSVVAIWRLWAWITAAAIFTVETMHDLFRAEVEGLLATKTPGTLLWYKNMCLGFRYGVGLVVVDGRIGYPLDDNTPTLLAQCSVREDASGLIIKIAKQESGELVPLDVDEFSAFTAFLQAVKYAGTQIRIVNSPANLLWIEGQIFYDPLVFKPTGESIAGGERPVDIAIEAYLRNLPFDGRLKRSELIAAIKAVEGVADVHLYVLKQKYAAYDYADIEISHIPESGYYRIDNEYPLTDALDYIVYV